jgi:hypothetical protein
MTGRLWIPVGIVLLFHPGRFSEGLALVKDPQRDLREHGWVGHFGGPAYVAFGQVFQHP